MDDSHYTWPGALAKSVSGTKEWPSSSANCMDGCSNDCRYCYFRRKTADSWKDERPRQAVLEKGSGTIMFPISHDLTHENIKYCEEVLVKLLAAGNKVLVVSKPHPDMIERLCLRIQGWDGRAREQVLFRFTIGSMNPSRLRFWEPGAPTFAERLYSLMWAHRNGWQTSVSMEPMLDESHLDIAHLVYTVEPYVTDAIWLGKMNGARARVALNCGEIPRNVELELNALIESQSDGRIRTLYDTLKGNAKVKWKESIKKIVGIEVPMEEGLDI